MDRRELIKLISLTTGAILAVPLSSSLLTACKNVEKTEDLKYNLQFFNNEDFSLIKKLIDIILPKTDSPSASDVGVHQVIDTIISSVYNKKQQIQFTEKFTSLKQFLDNTVSLETLKSLSESSDSKDEMVRSAFLDLKQQTVAYYLTTEEISKNYLNYLPVPGNYEPCISLDEVDGKAWAL